MKSLQQVIHAVQYELDCSISELSRKLDKSRNYLSTTMKKGLSQEKEQQLIEKLLELVDDENAMLRNVVKEKNKLIDEKQSFIDNLDNERNELWCYKKWAEVEIKEKNDLLKIKQSVIAHQDSEIEKYTAMCDTQRLFIDGQDKEIQDHKKSLEALAKAGHSTSASLRKAETKNRILIGALIGVGLLWAVSAWVMS